MMQSNVLNRLEEKIQQQDQKVRFYYRSLQLGNKLLLASPLLFCGSIISTGSVLVSFSIMFSPLVFKKYSEWKWNISANVYNQLVYGKYWCKKHQIDTSDDLLLNVEEKPACLQELLLESERAKPIVKQKKKSYTNWKANES